MSILHSGATEDDVGCGLGDRGEGFSGEDGDEGDGGGGEGVPGVPVLPTYTPCSSFVCNLSRSMSGNQLA